MKFLIDGQRVHMSPRERDVFAVLYNNRGFVSMSKIIDKVYRDDQSGGSIYSDEIVRACVRKLRFKLGGTRFRIRNIQGHGYAMVRL
jgi:DNA-binding response OmpR family regulator